MKINEKTNFWENKKVLITGNTGFKGSWLTLYLLKKKAKVFGFSLKDQNNNLLFKEIHNNIKKNSTFEFHNISGDINNIDSITQTVIDFEPDIIFHLAAQPLVINSYKDPIYTWQTNVIGSMNLLKACNSLKKKCSIIITTTDKVYENKEWVYGYRENDNLGGHDPYSASKAALEICVSSWIKSFIGNDDYQNNNLSIATVRAGNVIGGGDWSESRIVPDIVRSILNKKILNIRYPLSIRPWQHVLEPLNGYVKLAELMHKNHKVNPKENIFNSSFNFGPGKNSNKKVKDLVLEFYKHWEGQYFFERIESNLHEAGLLTLVSEKAELLINWKSKWDFETTIKYTAQWYKDFYSNKSAYDCCIRDINEFEKS